MGLKLEIVLILAIIAILSVSFNTELSNHKNSQTIFKKEIEFTDTTFIEVDTNRTQGVAYSKYGVRDHTVLTLYDIEYHTDNIESLHAKRGIYKQNMIYLDNHIEVNQKEGFKYRTEHAVYNKKTEILNLTSPFTAVMGKNIIHGKSLRYDSRKKEAYAKDIDAVVYTIEK